VSELYQMIQPTLQVLRQFLVRNWEIKQNVSLALSAINQLTISDQADQKSIDTRAGLEECANDYSMVFILKRFILRFLRDLYVMVCIPRRI
jgi:hypothetical protein